MNTHELQQKYYYDSGTRHHNECYNAAIAADGQALAYGRVDGKRESLLLQDAPDAAPHILAQSTYILSPHFAGDFLFWVERMEGEWVIRATNRKDTSRQIRQPFAHNGRPLSLASCRSGETSWLVWEERQGKSTRVRLARISGGEIRSATDVTNGEWNAYDPAVAVAADGSLYVAYCAFRWGNYRILLQKLSGNGELEGDPLRLSNSPAACTYPSLWPRREGGVWFSFTHYDVPAQSDSPALVQHHRRYAQQSFYVNSGMVSAGIFDGQQLWGVMAPSQPDGVQGDVAAMKVFGSQSSGHSQIFEDAAGRAHLLLRRHFPLDAAEPQFAACNRALRRSSGASVSGSTQLHPDICLMTLHDSPQGWGQPQRIISRAHLEAPLSFALHENRLNIGFTEDPRMTGWNTGAEWFDDESELGVGIATVQLDSTTPAYELRPFVLSPVPGPSLQAHRASCERSEYFHALGQTHLHTSTSVCIREKDKEAHLNYRFMQDVQGCDFGGPTDHDFNMWHTEALLMRKLAEYYYFPGEFVALQGYEWTGTSPQCTHDGGPFGHLNVLSFEENADLEIYCAADSSSAGRSPARLQAEHRGEKVLALPHHVADSIHQFRWQFFDERFMPVVEIFQDYRGSGEGPRAPGVTNFLHQESGHWAVEAMRQGRRFGFIAGGDHCGFALAGVLTRELTRSGLYEALTARRCYGTTGEAVQVEFTCNGELAGSTLGARQGDFQLTISSPSPLHEVQIVRNGDDWQRHSVASNEAELQWQAKCEQGEEFWYCRVILQNGEMAWSSPIWLNRSA